MLKLTQDVADAAGQNMTTSVGDKVKDANDNLLHQLLDSATGQNSPAQVNTAWLASKPAHAAAAAVDATAAAASEEMWMLSYTAASAASAANNALRQQ